MPFQQAPLPPVSPSRGQSLVPHQSPHLLDELRKLGGPPVPVLSVANGNGAGFLFLVPDDEHERDFLELRLPDLETDLFVASVELELVWDPPWDPDMMSEAAKLELNM